MGSSPAFASTAPDSVALFRLGFPAAPPLKGLTMPDTVTRRIIMQKARGQAEPKLNALPPLVGTGFQVQCPPLIGVLPTVRSPYWVRYRSSGRTEPCRMVPADSGRVSRARPYLGTEEEDRALTYGTITRCGAIFQRTSARFDP